MFNEYVKCRSLTHTHTHTHIVTVLSPASSQQFPVDESHRVDIDTKEIDVLEIDGALQEFGCHITPGSHLHLGVLRVLGTGEGDGEAEVADNGGQIGLDQYVRGLDVAVYDARLDLLRVQVLHAFGDRESHAHHLRPAYGVLL